VSPTLLQIRLHALELAPLIAAARWALEDGTGSMPAVARQQLRQVLDSYDREMSPRRTDTSGPPAGPPSDE
jgi:hypothetical protein